MLFFSLPGAVISDAVTTASGVPFYAPKSYKIGDVTRAVLDAMAEEWNQ